MNFMSLLALNFKLLLILNYVSFRPLNFRYVRHWTFRRVLYFDGFADGLADSASEDDGVTFLQVVGQNHVESLKEDYHFHRLGSQKVLNFSTSRDSDLGENFDDFSASLLLLLEDVTGFAVGLQYFNVSVFGHKGAQHFPIAQVTQLVA